MKQVSIFKQRIIQNMQQQRLHFWFMLYIVLVLLCIFFLELCQLTDEPDSVKFTEPFYWPKSLHDKKFMHIVPGSGYISSLVNGKTSSGLLPPP